MYELIFIQTYIYLSSFRKRAFPFCTIVRKLKYKKKDFFYACIVNLSLCWPQMMVQKVIWLFYLLFRGWIKFYGDTYKTINTTRAIALLEMLIVVTTRLQLEPCYHLKKEKEKENDAMLHLQKNKNKNKIIMLIQCSVFWNIIPIWRGQYLLRFHAFTGGCLSLLHFSLMLLSLTRLGLAFL